MISQNFVALLLADYDLDLAVSVKNDTWDEKTLENMFDRIEKCLTIFSNN